MRWLALAAAAVAGCSAGSADDSEPKLFRDTISGIAFRYPADWSVSGFSTTNSPSRVVVASFPLPKKVVEGDCGGLEAARRLTDDGAFVLLIDYGPELGRRFPRRPARFALRPRAFAEYECFGPSYLIRFRSGGRNLQAHVALGKAAQPARTRQALAILQSVVVGRAP